MSYLFARSIFRMLALTVALVCTTLLTAQQTYETGYLITTDGQRESVQILNVDWRYTPTTLTVLRDGSPTIIDPATLTEFAIPGKARFVNHTVQLERSSTETQLLADAPSPQEEQRILLRTEVEGPASLYSYRTPQLTKFFLQLEAGTPPVQLMYQRWQGAGTTVRTNEQYVTQLRSALQCGTTSISAQTDYQLRELRKVVLDYNSCRGAASTIYTNNAARGKRLYIGVTPGVFFGKFELVDPGNDRMLVSMEAKASPRIGLELEYRLPFGNNKIALVFEPNYYRYKSSGTYSPVSRIEMAAADYSALELPVGLRYYSYLSSGTKAFATVMGGYNFFSGEIMYDRGPDTELKGSFTASAGLGLRFREHFGIEVRYQHNTDNLGILGQASRSGGIRAITSYVF
ncbi:hypothetical protein LEM8419_01696 [Neolewinella maritima]|uniref:Outer membrane protein beta-barrel domain-containing protein n=1 Tax=Neolewinella maritima TaxID=1383882 RepID=A0ABN8F2E6_9BACT|nr:outer membrane beta-barrel protein [Neolewinella maritima]CAH1000562.1 hypothetical protein LEM8419_01696 [Neolewinella maritima]